MTTRRNDMALGGVIAACLVAGFSVPARAEDAVPPAADGAASPAPAAAPTDASTPPASPAPAAAGTPAPGTPAPGTPATPGVAAEAPVSVMVDVDALNDQLFIQQQILEQHVSDAKERDVVAKVKLHTFNEEVLKRLEPPGGARLSVVHRNTMNAGFKLVGIAYALDGGPLFAKLDVTGKLNDRGQITVFDGKVLPGQHEVAVQYDLRGEGVGIFAYLDEIQMVLRRTYSFKVEPLKETRLVGTLSTDNGVTTQFNERPKIAFETAIVERAPDKAPGTPDAPGAGQPPPPPGTPPPAAPAASTPGSTAPAAAPAAQAAIPAGA